MNNEIITVNCLVVPFFMHSFFYIMNLESVLFNLKQYLINKHPDTVS